MADQKYARNFRTYHILSLHQMDFVRLLVPKGSGQPVLRRPSGSAISVVHPHRPPSRQPRPYQPRSRRSLRAGHSAIGAGEAPDVARDDLSSTASHNQKAAKEVSILLAVKRGILLQI